MWSTRRSMVDVVLIDDDRPDEPAEGPLDPPKPPRDRRLAWQRRARRWWPLAAGLAFVLLTTTVVADRREHRRLAALADVPGVLAPLGDSVTERWHIDDPSYWLLGSTATMAIGVVDRPDGSGAVVGRDATTGNVAWEAATRPAGPTNGRSPCVLSRPAPPSDGAPAGTAVVVCVPVDETERITTSGAEMDVPSKARLLVIDATDGAVLVDRPTDPSTIVTSASTYTGTSARTGVDADLVTTRVLPDGRAQVSRASAWDAPARWTFTTPDPLGSHVPLGTDHASRYQVWGYAAGDLVLVAAYPLNGEDKGQSWVLDADGTVLRPANGGDPSTGNAGGFGVLRAGELLVEPGTTSGTSTLTHLATGRTLQVDAQPFDALPDDGSLDDLVLAQSQNDDLIAYDLTTGTARWTVPSPGIYRAMIIDGRVIRVEDDHLVSYDGRSGRTVWSKKIPSTTTGSYGSMMAPSAFTDGRVVLLADSGPSDSTSSGEPVKVTAYGLDDGRTLWTSTLPPGVQLYERDGALYGQSDEGIYALD
ncbi:PQQ-binding-like beta-propeller repeat protein [Pengzhenrongella phosphoraccumulans]|uniref:outer membrane protein assembly factor BamB family protein n=1 Tax=Pengzhenrongella phosphoraccumulans TaxID=3114394 RepID=UPI00388E8DB7